MENFVRCIGTVSFTGHFLFGLSASAFTSILPPHIKKQSNHSLTALAYISANLEMLKYAMQFFSGSRAMDAAAMHTTTGQHMAT